MRRALAILVVAGALVLGPGAAISAGQSDGEPFTADETAGDIERIRTSLFVIAAVTGGLLVLYIWHTNPRRRMDVAVRRRDAREQEQMDFLDGEFVLPGEIEEQSTDT